MQPILDVKNLNKTYAGGFEALKDVSLEIERGEIFGLLGPNGAGKTTLINIVCGIVNATSGSVRVGGNDIVTGYRATRAMIGLVPQELPVETFESVWNTASFSRGLFGKPPNPEHIEKVLRSLSLWDKKDSPIMGLSGGMKRRVLIAKALAHEPSSCSWTSRPRAWTSSFARPCGTSCGNCASPVSRSSSRRTTSRKPSRWPTGSA